MRRAPRGFTLVEVGMVLFVVALLMGVAVPTLRSISGATARASVGKLAANIRAARGHAAVSGQTCRLVMDLDASAYMIECAEGIVRVERERELGGKRADDSNKDEEEDLSRLTDAERTKREILRKAAFAPAPFLQPQKLDGVGFTSVWVQHQEDDYTKGSAYLYFFPNGLTELANIQLSDGDDAFYSVHVSPQSGRVRLYPEKKELPEGAYVRDDS